MTDRSRSRPKLDHSQFPLRPRLRPPFPSGWIWLLFGVLAAYALLQPWVNSRLGWRLPAVTSIFDESASPEILQEKPKATAEESSTRENSTRDASAGQLPGDSELLHGLLREIGPERYASPAGLVYGPGSEQGHRLKHLERHLRDIPDRPGNHGVFDGQMPQVLQWIDEAYGRVQRGDGGAKANEQSGGRTVVEVAFNEPIGYVGGKEGGRAGNPPTTHLRLVLEGKNVVTAFPY